MNKNQIRKVKSLGSSTSVIHLKLGEQLDQVLDQTIEFIADGEKEIYEIRSYVQREYDDLEKKLIDLKVETSSLIISVDKLYQIYDLNRKKLININAYNKEEFRRLQKETEELQIRLELEKDKERTIILRRNDLEIQLRSMKDLNDRAEKLSSDFSITMSLLNGGIKKVTDTIEDINNKQAIGVKILQAQEEERRRIAREMHDGLAQQLSQALISAEFSVKLLDKDINVAKRELNAMKLDLRESIGNIRRMIYNLRPMSLDDLGLIPTIQRDVEAFQKNNPDLNLRFSLSNELEENRVSMSETVILTVYRIFQEGLSNIKKHSQAKNIKIELKTRGNKLLIRIEDDGIGLPDESVEGAIDHGFGLSIMRERVDLLRGKIDVQSEKNMGTKIKIEIPIEKGGKHE